MEPFATYNLTTPPKPDLFTPSPFCRKANKPEKDTDEGYSPLKFTVSDPGKVLLLCEKLNENSTKALEIKINKYLMKEAECSSVFIIDLRLASEEAVVQAVGKDALESPIRLPLSENVIKSLVKYENQTLKCDSNLDPQILAVLNEVITDHDSQIISVPILSNRQKSYQCFPQTLLPVFLICFVNTQKDDEMFLVKLANELFRYCLTLLLNTAEAEEEARKKRQCQSLLTVARKFFSYLEDVNDLLREIMAEAKNLTNAERCSLFLLDPDHMHLVAKVFDGASPTKVDSEVRIARDQGIAGHVATTGELLNIKNAYEHPLFYKGMDEATGFKTRNILCFPIRDEKGIVGVAQLCNKIGGSFDYFDEEIANAFSIYCGLSIMHSLVYKQIQVAQARNKLSNELMMYHMKVSDEDVERKMNCNQDHTHPDLCKFSFSPRIIPRNETVCFVLNMFEDLDFMESFMIKKDTLTRFVMFVERLYRDPPYHNWMHAFSVSHFAYLCLKNLQLVQKGYITNLEALAYFISCLCHDIDHRGTNNSFQQTSNSVLASLYSSQGSVMERHHLSQTMCTLNTEGCNILESFNHDDYSLCLDLIRDMVLATDLATHFKLYSRQYDMVKTGYNRNNPEHRYAFVCLLMTCADLSDQTKGWTVVKKVSESIYEEFFTQGDLEKKMGREPLAMMDRQKARIPDLQIEFLNQVCLPVFKLLSVMFRDTTSLLTAIKRNILCWESSKCIFETAINDGKTPLEVLASEELETEVQNILEVLDRNK